VVPVTQFARTKVELTGFDGAPGVNIYNWCGPAHADITQSFVENFNESLSEALTALAAGAFATGVRWTIDQSVSVHEVDTGDLVGGFIDPNGPYSILGTGNGSESRATQVGFRWLTADFRNGRRVRGCTYMGPAASECLASDGSVAPSLRATFAAAMSGIIDPLASRLIVWSRPSVANPVGQYADVVECQIAPKPFTLKGRRD